ncbi:MAG: hypothetical protein A3F15_02930 [Candidatus Wildermuthbacteria bacterium RIFCSPHIGHO2_12_FULL_40_12]|nr:MAG: hypothetical protein A3F15_02930 [Candidatus Wildermuthbacteria bacterium RIFCSPHIGHO2_12_FULL_40_12]
MLQLLLTSHLFILPLSKKRPVFLDGIEGSLFFFTFLAIIATIIHPLIYIFALVLAFFVYYTHCWIVYGVPMERINNALDRAIIGGKSTSVKKNKGLEIDDNMFVRIVHLGMNICFIQYKNKIYSKKSELIKQIFKKFIQNYFI